MMKRPGPAVGLERAPWRFAAIASAVRGTGPNWPQTDHIAVLENHLVENALQVHGRPVPAVVILQAELAVTETSDARVFLVNFVLVAA